MINWLATKEEYRLISMIINRAVELNIISYQKTKRELGMDIVACHCNGCPLDLQKLLLASDFEFQHDVRGISYNIDRETGKLDNCFVPRCAKSYTDDTTSIVFDQMETPYSC